MLIFAQRKQRNSFCFCVGRAGETIKSDYGKATYAVVIGAVAIFIIYTVNVPGIKTSRNIINAFKINGAGDAKGTFELFKSYFL